MAQRDSASHEKAKKHLTKKLEFWRSKYPRGRQAEELMEILQPFYRARLTLRPAIPNLVQVVEDAAFWMPNTPKVRVVRMSECRAFNFPRDPPVDVLDAILEQEVSSAFRDLLSREGPQMDSILASVLSDDCGSSLESLLRFSFEHVLAAACEYVLVGNKKKAQRCNGLLKLYRQGNFPFHQQPHPRPIISVLVAD